MLISLLFLADKYRDEDSVAKYQLVSRLEEPASVAPCAIGGQLEALSRRPEPIRRLSRKPERVRKGDARRSPFLFQARLSLHVNDSLIDCDQARLYDTQMIGNRFRKARLERGMTLREVGQIIGVTPQAVGQWEKSNPQFTLARTTMLANIFQVDFEWLEGESGTDDEVIFVNDQDRFTNEVPLVNKLEALTFMIHSITTSDKNDYKKGSLIPSAKIVGRGFAFEMDDDSMQPMVQRNDILIFDPGIAPTEDDIIFAITYESGGMINPIIRLYSEAGETSAGDKKINLKSMNEFYKSYALNDGSLGLVFAVLVELRMVRPKGWRARS